MFTLLFERPHALARHLNGPLAEDRERFLRHLAARGMARRSMRQIACYLLAAVRYLRLAARPGEAVSYAEVEEQAMRWAKRRHKPSKTRRRLSRAQFLRYAASWLRFMGRLTLPPTPPNPYSGQLAAFADFVRHEKGWKPRTIQNCCSTVLKILNGIDPKKNCIRKITLDQIDQTLLKRGDHGPLARTTLHFMAWQLRSFFRYAAANGWCDCDLASGIKTPRVFAQESLPLGPSWNDVRRLIATTEGDWPTNIRDRALLLLLAVYGLRACEVRCLRLDDFDWRQEMLTVRRTKTRSVQTYPLSRSVGAAVIRYLREVRPHSAHREVFLIRHPPFSPFRNEAIGTIVRRRFQALKLALPHYGSHALRHACATHLLAQGLSLKEIGDHLGHRDPDTTRIYAKVDLTGLQQVADFDLGELL